MTRLGPADFTGILAMMPAFATADGAESSARETVAVRELERAVDRIVRDGIDAIATTGSFGEFHTLLFEEFCVLVEATVAAVRGRVPVLVGVGGLNTRSIIQLGDAAIERGADGLLIGAPFYFPATLDNAAHFFRTMAERYPDHALAIYHNPPLHKVTLPIGLIRDLVDRYPNIVAMKDPERDTRTFAQLTQAVGSKLSIFVAPWQYEPYADLGAAGFWSYDCWMGPTPHLELLEAVRTGQRSRARELIAELHPAPPVPPSLSWRETAGKLAVAHADYCDPGPLRSPFVIVPDEVDQAAARRARNWERVATNLRNGDPVDKG